MKNKLIMFLIAVAAMCVFLSACSNKEETMQEESTTASADTGELENVHLSIWAGAEDEQLIATIAEKFIKENADKANITIEWSPMIEGECRSNLLGDVLNGPDVYTTTDGDIRAIVAGGAASPIINPEQTKKDNLQAAVDAVTINGTIYGYPITADNCYFLYYNKKYFSEDDIKKLDTMLDIAKKAKKKVVMEWASGWYLYTFFGETGLNVGLNADGVTNFCDWNSTTNDITGVEVCEALLDIAEHDGFEAMLNSEWIEDVKSGKVIAGVSGVWDETAVKEAWGDNYGAAKLPTYTCDGKQVQMSTYFGYKMIGVNPYSENLEWAHKFAEYIANEENQKLRFEMRGQGPSNLNAANSPEVAKATAIQAALAQSEFSELQRLGGNFWAPTTNLGNILAAGNPDKLDLQERMDNTVTEIISSTVQ